MKLLVPPSFTLTAPRASVPLSPPPAEAVAPLAEITHVLALYHRYFAGQERGSRDPELLAELRERLVQARVELLRHQPQHPHALGPHLQDLGHNLGLFDHELGLIRRAAARPAWIGARIDAQVTTWRRHFEQRPRLSRRAGLARRIGRALRGAQVGEHAETAARLADHAESEAREIEAVQAGATMDQRLDGLRAAVEEEVTLYRTQIQPVASPDPELRLGGHERLGEVHLQARWLAGQGTPDAAAIADDVRLAWKLFDGA